MAKRLVREWKGWAFIGRSGKCWAVALDPYRTMMAGRWVRVKFSDVRPRQTGRKGQ
jgi:hypothetical protein